jgi:hypothetical protein
VKIVFRRNYLENDLVFPLLYYYLLVNKYGHDSSGYYIATDVFLRAFENAAVKPTASGRNEPLA